MKETIRRFYEGEGRGPRAFQAGLIIFDVVIIAYFVLTANADMGATLLSVDLSIGAVVLADLAARFSIAERRAAFMLSLTTIADIVVLLSLLAPVLTGANLGFLRALRMLRLARSFHMAERLDEALRGSLVNSRIMVAAANLAAFIFVVTSMVWVLERQKNDDIATYVDALYFTITTLTTTGYGDITLTDRTGRFFTIVIMVFGVGFFREWFTGRNTHITRGRESGEDTPAPQARENAERSRRRKLPGQRCQRRQTPHQI